MDKLKANELTIWEALAVSVAIMAPTAAMALNGSLAASICGTAVPLAFLFALITIALVSYAFIQFNKHFSSSGSVMAFTTASLGPKIGFLSGWALLLTYLAFCGCNAAEVGAFLQNLLSMFSVNVSWILIAVITTVVVILLSYLDVRVSTRTMLILEVISVCFVLTLTIIILSRGGAAHHLTLKPFTFNGVPFSAVGLASVFAFLSFAGFEGASSMGEETKNPTRVIPLAIMCAVFITGIFYVLVTYAQSVGFGLGADGVKAFANSSAPLGDLAKAFVSPAFAAIIMLGATLSAFSCFLGTVATASRMLFAMGRDGFAHRSLGEVHPKYGSPYVALVIVMVVSIICVACTSYVPGIDAFGYLGTIGVLSLLLAYLVTQIGGMAYFTKKKIWSVAGWMFPIGILAIIMLGYTLWSNIWPIPAPPMNYFPYGVIAWIIIGIVLVFTCPNLVHNIAKRFIEEIKQ